jgi:hypothetical protein
MMVVKGVYPMSQAAANDHASRFQPPPRRYYTGWGIISISVLLLVILGGALFYYLYYFNASERYFRDEGGAVASLPIKVGQVFAVGIPFNAISDTETITMRPVTLPNGLPAHSQIIRQEITSAGVLIWPDWPNNWPDPLVVHPLDGYRIGPHTTMIAVLVLRIDAPGTYTFGPFTIHAEAAGPIGNIPIYSTVHIYFVACLGVSKEACDAAVDAAAH